MALSTTPENPSQTMQCSVPLEWGNARTLGIPFVSMSLFSPLDNEISVNFPDSIKRQNERIRWEESRIIDVVENFGVSKNRLWEGACYTCAYSCLQPTFCFAEFRVGPRSLKFDRVDGRNELMGTRFLWG